MSTETVAVPAIIGYVDPLRACPGGTLDFKISSAGGRPFKARVVRIDCADPNPAGPGMKLQPVDAGLPSTPHPGTEQPVHAGSCALAPLPALAEDEWPVLELVFQSTLAKPALQALACLQERGGGTAAAFCLRDNRLVLAEWRSGAPAGETQVGDLAIRPRRWYRLKAQFSAQAVDVSLAAIVDGVERPSGSAQCRLSWQAWPAAVDTLALAARWAGFPVDCFNGRLEHPRIFRAGAGRKAEQELLAAWDFSAEMTTQRVPCSVRPDAFAELVNAPTRAVCSSGWTGKHMDWKTAPQDYAAIHFHEDDLSDCAWQTSLALRIPAGMASAVYGLVVENELGSDTIPFFVTPAPDGPRARIAYLASTMTYLAYANHARGNYQGELEERIRAWGAYPHNPDVVQQFGASTYNYHADGSGISLSSRLRPILGMRPGYLTFADQNGSGLRHFPADSHLTDWLRVKGYEFDVITDEDLDDDGVAALQPYELVLTGSHPEYHTPRMMQALLQYRRQGGHLCYLGGNGFYWKIARPAHAPHMLEIRRAEGGIRAWAAEPGEYYHQLDGGYGGLWRRNGCPPQKVGGVGFTVQGLFEGSYYRRTPESYAPEANWIFEGVDAERIGDFGLSGGGAAGFELDQVDEHLGTPDGTIVVAASEGHGPSFMTTPEEILTWTLPAATTRPHGGICGHMIYTAPAGGEGGLFAVGSITFLGSLSHNGYDNPISTILENCIKHFAASEK